jgi:hypothetical protein
MLKVFKAEATKALISRLWPTGALFLSGTFLILYAALGIVYYQQTAKQEELQEQITQIRSVVSKPLPPAKQLQAEYEKVNQALAPISVKEALDIIVKIAEESGIVLDPESAEFTIPPVDALKTVKLEGSEYGVLSISGIQAQGDYDNVMAFIAKLDRNEQMETMILKGCQVTKVEFEPTDEEDTRRTEFYKVSSAIISLMADNELTEIPNPMDFADGIAVNTMGDDPDTLTKVEGFPDMITTIADKGYSGEESPRNGYVLYEHDKITATDNFTTISYISGLDAEYKTEYYYTCEADGTVRQFDGPDVTKATEYPHNEREARRRELYLITEAIKAMMPDNDLVFIPRPMNFISGVATNLLGDDPATKTQIEGFPDISTNVEDKGYTGEYFPRNGYVLYEHDKILSENTTLYETVKYLPFRTTKYYYTCERDGTVRQYDGPNVSTAKEYLLIDTIANLDIDIYTKPAEEE